MDGPCTTVSSASSVSCSSPRGSSPRSRSLSPGASAAAGPHAHASIVGGSETAAGSWPSVAYVTTDLGDGTSAACTGTVVAPGAVLTAAHCVVDQSRGEITAPEYVTVVTGRRDLDSDAGRDHGVVRVVVHPGYDVASERNDVALLALDSPAAAPPIALAGDRALTAAGSAAAIAGWGSLDGAATIVPTLLRAAGTTLLSDAQCGRQLRGFDAATMLCAADVTRLLGSTCHGDSGGPLAVAAPDGTVVQVGITSWGTAACSARVPQVFTRVSAVAGWIAEQLPAMTPPAGDVNGPGGGSGASGSAGAPGTAGADGGDGIGVSARRSGGTGGRRGGSAAGGGTSGSGDAAGRRAASALAGARFRGRTTQQRRIVVRLAGDGSGVGAVDLRYRVACGSAWYDGRLRSTALTVRAHVAGGFDVVGRGADGTRLRLVGRFAGSRRVSGTLRLVLRKSGCDSGVVRYDGRR